MYKYSFYNEYSEGAHPDILDLMAKTNLNQEDGYGNDTHSQKVRGVRSSDRVLLAAQ